MVVPHKLSLSNVSLVAFTVLNSSVFISQRLVPIYPNNSKCIIVQYTLHKLGSVRFLILIFHLFGQKYSKNCTIITI